MHKDMLRSTLQDGLDALSIIVTDLQVEQLIDYVLLINKWNKVYNLTAIRDPREMVTLHLLDSLSILNYVNDLKQETILDVGAGAGLPSIPLAICLPELRVFAIDAVQKKEIFMRQVKGELGLKNFSVLSGRVENLTRDKLGLDGGVDLVVSRAFSEIALMMRLTSHLLKRGGQWLAMKGLVPLSEYEDEIEPESVIKLDVPKLDAERHLIIFRN